MKLFQVFCLFLFYFSLKIHSNTFLKLGKIYNLKNLTNYSFHKKFRTKAICLTKINEFLFDLNTLPIHKIHVKGENGEIIKLNLCRNSISQCHVGKSLIINEKLCKRFSSHKNLEKTFVIMNDSLNKSMLRIILPDGDICDNTNNHTIARYKTTIDFECDLDSDLYMNQSQIISSKKCNNSIKIKSKYACTNQKYVPWWELLGINKLIISIGIMILGLYFIIFGLVYKTINSLVINLILSTIVFYSVFNLFFHINLLTCLLLSGILVYFWYNFNYLSTLFLGINLGFLTANLIYYLLALTLNINPQTLFWCNVVFFISIVSVTGLFVNEVLYEIMFRLFGVYLLARGVYILTKGTTDENFLISLINRGEFNQLFRIYNEEVGSYNLCILGFTIIIVLGFNFLTKKENKKENQDINLVDK